MTDNIKIGKYARISFINAGIHQLAVINGIKEKHQFVANYAKTNGVEKALQLVFEDLGFHADTVDNEVNAEILTQKNQRNNREVWRWDNWVQPIDPIRVMFETSLTFEKA